MLTITIGEKKIREHKVGAYLFVVSEEQNISTCVSEARDIIPSLDLILKQREFTGKKEQCISISAIVNNKVVYCIFVGVGKSKNSTHISVEQYRRAIGKGVRHTASLKISSLAVVPPSPELFGIDLNVLVKETIVVVNMTTYKFDEFITENKDRKIDLVDLVICGDVIDDTILQETVDHAKIISHAVNKARLWIDMPPSMLTPPRLAEKAEEIAKKHNMAVTLFGEKEIIKMGMGGLAAVSRGSDVECRLVILEYKTDKKNAQTLAFVGKGITFDSGGLSLKPPRYMETMKEDMSGAAAVIASMEALAQLKPNVNIIGVAALSENLPSGKATKPGDIVQFYNGKTAEVKNTDAEGRLVLADALSYVAEQYKPDAIIDLATLTGACAYALGPFHAGMMSEHDDFVKKVQEAANKSGDRVWRLPLGDDYKSAIKSPIADICNIGNEKIQAGAITAGHFLQHFVDDIPWVHLDIAGTAYGVPNIPYYREGATGYGVRLLVDLAIHWA